MKEKYRLMTVKEVCVQFKISRRTLYRMLKTKRLPAFKVGHQWRFRYGDMEGYFMRLMHQAPSLYDVKVIDKYRSNPERYEIEETEKGGVIKPRREVLHLFKKVEIFDFIRYTYRQWRGQKVVKLMPHEKARLDYCYTEGMHWAGFEIRFEQMV